MKKKVKKRVEKPVPFVALTDDELGGLVGSSTECPNCGKQHKVEYADEIKLDGTRVPSTMLGFVKCGKHSYMVAIKGRSTSGILRRNRERV